MANTIQIKRGTLSGKTAPDSLAEGEIAFAQNGLTFYIGVDDGNGGTVVKAIGGQIGSVVQGFSKALESISGLTTNADELIFTTGSDTYATAKLTAKARELISKANETDMRTVLNVDVAGTDNSTPVTLDQNNKSYITAGGTGNQTLQLQSIPLADTKITAGSGININADTISLTDTGVKSGSYGSGTKSVSLNIDAKGRITNVGENDIATVLKITDGTNNDSVNLSSDTFTFTVGNGTNLTATVSDNKLTVGIADGYVIPTTGNVSNWNKTYNWYQTMTADDDADNVINTWKELVTALNNAGEDAHLLIDSSTIDGGTF
jgi:hypothetical protein